MNDLYNPIELFQYALDLGCDELVRKGVLPQDICEKTIRLDLTTSPTLYTVVQHFERMMKTLNSTKGLYISNRLRKAIFDTNHKPVLRYLGVEWGPYPCPPSSAIHHYMKNTFSQDADGGSFSIAWGWAIALFIHEGIDAPMQQAIAQASKAQRFPSERYPGSQGYPDASVGLPQRKRLWEHPAFAGLYLTAKYCEVPNWELLLMKSSSAERTVARTIKKATGLEFNDVLDALRITLNEKPRLQDAYTMVQELYRLHSQRANLITELPSDLQL